MHGVMSLCGRQHIATSPTNPSRSEAPSYQQTRGGVNIALPALGNNPDPHVRTETRCSYVMAGLDDREIGTRQAGVRFTLARTTGSAQQRHSGCCVVSPGGFDTRARRPSNATGVPPAAINEWAPEHKTPRFSRGRRVHHPLKAHLSQCLSITSYGVNHYPNSAPATTTAAPRVEFCCG